MIQITLKTAILLYLGFLSAAVCAIWLYTEVSTRGTFRRLTRQNFWQCEYCGYSYLDDEAVEISRCPRCESFNSLDG